MFAQSGLARNGKHTDRDRGVDLSHLKAHLAVAPEDIAGIIVCMIVCMKWEGSAQIEKGRFVGASLHFSCW